MEPAAAQRSDQPAFASLPALRRLLPLLLLTPATAAVVLTVSDRKSAFDAFLQIPPLPVAAALLLGIVPWFTDAARTAVWCRFLGRPVPYIRLCGIAAAAELGAAVVPPFVGTVPVKTVLLTRENFTTGEALSLTTLSSLEDWVFYLIALPFCLAAAGDAWLPDLRTALPALLRAAAWAAGCGAVMVLAALSLRRRWPGRLDRLSRWFRGMGTDLYGVFRLVAARGAVPFVITLVLTAVQWGCRYSITAVLIAGMGLPVQPALLFALQIIIYGLTTIVPTPGGAVGAEALFALLHSPHLPGEALGVATVAWRVASFYSPVLLALLAMAAASLRPWRRSYPGASVSRDE